LFIRVTVVLGCTWLLARLAQRRSAAVRHGIWAAGMTAALCVPAGRVFLPEISVEIPSVPGASLVAIERAPDAGIVEEARGTPSLAVGGRSEVFMASSGADVGVPD